MESKRVQIILTDDIANAMREIAEKHNSNISAMVRLALTDWLQENYTIELDHRLVWGGDRSKAT